MATFDKLSAEERAIIELVLQRGQSYDELASTLGMPSPRVRELAREALSSLAPVTAARVEPEWRGQLADYVLGQQSGPESTATRGHLRRSEAARTWTRSLLDSLDHLYRDGHPTIPDGDRQREPRRPRRSRDEPPAAEAPAGDRPLSPAARAAIRRRRLVAGAAALALVAAFLILIWPGKVLTGGDDDEQKAGRQTAQGGARILGQLVLRPVKGEDGAGIAVIAERGGRPQLIVQARLKPNRNREAYEVWLYNSRDDARSLGAQVTDRQGTYQGAGPLPEDFDRYKFIDLSREPVDRNPKHAGDSVLRGRLDQIQPAPAGAGGAAPGGGGAAPGGGAPPPGGQPPPANP